MSRKKTFVFVALAFAACSSGTPQPGPAATGPAATGPFVTTLSFSPYDLQLSGSDVVVAGTGGVGVFGTQYEALTTNPSRLVGVVGGRAYWLESNAIYRAAIDNPVPQLLVAADGASARTLVRVVDGKLYWIRGSQLRRANLDGTSVEDLRSDISVNAFGSWATDGTNVLWADDNVGKLRTGPLTGTSSVEVNTALNSVHSIHLIPGSPSRFAVSEWTTDRAALSIVVGTTSTTIAERTPAAGFAAQPAEVSVTSDALYVAFRNSDESGLNALEKVTLSSMTIAKVNGVSVRATMTCDGQKACWIDQFKLNCQTLP